MKEEIKIDGKSGRMDGRTVPAQFNAGRVVYRGATPVNTKTLVKEDGRMTDGNRDALRRILIDALAKPGRTLLPTPMLFEADDVALTQGHEAFLDVLAEAMASGRCRVRLDGYAFEEGGAVRGGWEVSERRARAVADGLVARGVARSARRVAGSTASSA
jgi:outer membrane protein OmpA-like peptidoglycan-associated protein